MSKFLIDASSGKYLAIYMDGKWLPKVLRVDNIVNGKQDGLSEITLTFSTDEIKFKSVDGKIFDVLNGFSEVQDV